MKKQLIVLVFALALAAGVTFLIVVLQKRSEFERLKRLTHIPPSQPHQHVSPDGDVVSHTHTYNTPELIPPPEDTSVENDIGIDTDTKDYIKTNDIHRIWAALDLDAIRAEFQPYTLEEIHEMWSNSPIVPKFTGRTVGTERSPLTSDEELDIFRDRDAWIARLYEYGHPFLHDDHYDSALSTRSALKRIYNTMDEDYPHGSVGLPAEATWEEVEETFLKHQVISEIAFELAYQADPDNFAGGVYSINDVGKGVLTPFKENTVFVHVSEDKPFSQFTGAKLTAAEEADLRMFGVAPEGVNVIYTDKNRIPLPSDQKPRFYERAIQGLDAAEKRIEKLIADHGELFQQGNGVAAPKTEGAAGQPQPHPHSHPHQEESSGQTPQRPEMPSFPPQVLENKHPSDMPVVPQDPAQIEKWFAELLLLHGGDLPKDIKGLQEAIKVLNVIRKHGESEPPKPPERSVPQPPARK